MEIKIKRFFGSNENRKEECIWLRIGDISEYKEFPGAYEAGEAVGQLLCTALLQKKQEEVSFRYRSAGVMIEPYFTGRNYISLYWGDEEGDWIEDLSQVEKHNFELGVARELAD